MTNTKLVCFMGLLVAIAFAAQLAAQVQTEVPPVWPGRSLLRWSALGFTA